MFLVSTLLAAEPVKMHFDLPAGSAEKSIKRLSEQSGVDVLLPTKIAYGIQTNAVNGNYTAREALEQMLAGTGLIVEQDVKSGALAVRREAEAEAKNGARAVTRNSDRPEQVSRIDEPVYALSPFVVTSQGDDTYTAQDTLAGNRVRTNLSDVGSSVQVITKKFMDDTNSKKAEDLLVLTTSTEVSGQGGNFVGQGNGAYLTIAPSLSPATRVRGLDSADLTQDFFLTRIPYDTYNTGRVDIQRGPNSLLFGIGSPGGIINGTTNTAIFRNQNEVTNQVASYGSVRNNADFNRVLLKDELAIRLSLLSDETKYRQKPAFKDDHRISGSVKWDPKFLNQGSAHTSFTVNVEHGRITGNAPQSTPPADYITPYFTRPEFRDANGNLITYRSDEVNAIATGHSNPWIGGAPGYTFMTFEASGSQGLTFATPFAWPDNTLQQLLTNNDYATIAGYEQYAFNAGLVGSEIGAFRGKSLADASIFDFYNNLIYGPNAGEFDKFDTITANLTQTFFDNKLGFNFGYNRQASYFSSFADMNSAVQIDITSTLPSNGVVNPNVGRPYIPASSGGGKFSDETRETFRFTGFAEVDTHDFLGRDSLLAKILGRHVFTGLIDHYTVNSDNRSHLDTMIALNPNNWQSLNPTDNTSFGVNSMVYLGSDARQMNSPGGLNLGRVDRALNYLPTTIPEYNNLTNQWFQAPLEFIDNRALPSASKYYSSANLAKDVINSKVISWQAYLFEGSLVALAGYRTDTNDAYLKTGTRLPGTPNVDIRPGNYKLPTTASASVHGISRTYSLVGHLPEFARRKMPGRINLSPFFNQSENFRPSAGRIDFEGNALPSPTGKTKEYGVTLSALNDKLTFKFTKFESESNNATIQSDAAAAPILMMVCYAWGQASYYAKAFPNIPVPFEFLRNPSVGTTSDGKTLYILPPGTTLGSLSQAQIDAGYVRQQAILTEWAANAQLPESIQETFAMADYNDPSKYQVAFGDNPNVAVTGSTRSRGEEYELSANPLEGLVVSFNAAHVTSTINNLAPNYIEFYQKTKALLDGPAGELDLFGAGSITTREWFNQFAVSRINLLIATEGTAVPEIRPWHFNGTADYTFYHGMLKGVHLGGSYRWQDRIITGYPVITVDGLSTYDIQNPYKGASDGKLDAWIGYSRMVTKKLKWSTQLNVRNVFASKDLEVVTTQPDGSPAGLRIPEPRVIYWTNTFEF